VDETGKLRILHIEDNPVDAELVGHALRRSGLACDVRVAESRRECLIALDEGEFDLVLSDSHGHDFIGPELLRLVRQRLPQVPFLFLSGSYDDFDTAMLKAEGASDCLLKDELDILAPAVLRALHRSP
jgi:CheY-like chemotaxis protein